jgi:HAD superfamily hydrolase (TIGR01549 family)
VGALAAALFACVGDIPHEVIGKPEPTLFAIGCARLGIPAAQCIMIGDNPLTDGSGASRAGMRFLQVAP